MKHSIPDNQIPKVQVTGDQAVEALDRIYTEVMKAIERGDIIYTGSNTHLSPTSGLEPSHVHHIIITETVVTDASAN